jgi:hypothetical protein
VARGAGCRLASFAVIPPNGWLLDSHNYQAKYQPFKKAVSPSKYETASCSNKCCGLLLPPELSTHI